MRFVAVEVGVELEGSRGAENEWGGEKRKLGALKKTGTKAYVGELLDEVVVFEEDRAYFFCFFLFF